MKIAVDINHPGHVHFFKNFIWEMEKKGHEILITAIDKEVTYSLLDHYGFDYLKFGKHKSSMIKKITNLPILDFKMHEATKEFDPDILLGLGSIRISHVSFLLRKKCIIFGDTEHVKEQIMLLLPFANIVMTPSCYLIDLGPKQLRYNGYHELAYLHPNYFKPDSSILDLLGVAKDDNYVILRFVSWAASHDVGQIGLSSKEKMKLIKEIEQYAIPMITSEGPLPKELQKYQIKIPPHRIHDAMYYAKMYIGEGATMASEAAVMGTPAIYTNDLKLGYIDDEEKYGLVYQHRPSDDNFNKITENIKKVINTKETVWNLKKETLLKEKIDVTSFMIWFIENYPDSKSIMMEDPNYQKKFNYSVNEQGVAGK